MGKRKKTSRKSTVVQPYTSDDDEALDKLPIPDPESREYYYDDVDEFHAQREKILLDRGIMQPQEEISEDEELVLRVESSDDDYDDDFLDDEGMEHCEKQLQNLQRKLKKDEIESDIEDMDVGDDQVNKSWGHKRSKYYGADVDEYVELSGSEDEEGVAALEEREALALQKKIAAELDEDDFGLEVFKPMKKAELDQDEEKIEKDLTKLTKKEKLELLQKESPELLILVEDFMSKLTEIKDVWLPLHRFLQKSSTVPEDAVKYVETKFKLSLSYCTNISFYLMLKASHTFVHNHPVVNCIVQYRKLFKHLEPLDKKLDDQISEIMTKLKSGEKIIFHPAVSQKSVFKRQKATPAETEEVLLGKPNGQEHENLEVDASLDFNEESKNEGQDYDEEGEARRGITYEMAENKGLTPRRKKELKNPRVKHKMKYKRAKIRMKGKVRQVYNEKKRYEGELSGIRAGMKRGIKLT